MNQPIFYNNAQQIPMIQTSSFFPVILNPSVIADSFRSSIHSFVRKANFDHYPSYTMTQMCHEFGFHKRRLYDVINVFEAIGCCKKTSVDTIMWTGLESIQKTMKKLFYQDFQFDNERVGIDVLLSEKPSISISHLTISLMMLFYTLKTQSLDIKKVATFLSKNNGRFKTTLCKLYQITHILDSLSVIGKSAVPSEVMLLPPYYMEMKLNDHSPYTSCYLAKNQSSSPLSLEFLLSRPSNDIVSNRVKQFNMSVEFCNMNDENRELGKAQSEKLFEKKKIIEKFPSISPNDLPSFMIYDINFSKLV